MGIINLPGNSQKVQNFFGRKGELIVFPFENEPHTRRLTALNFEAFRKDFYRFQLALWQLPL